MTEERLFKVEREVPDLASFDVILANTSAGKDSQAMLDVLAELADAAGVRDRIVAVHCDLGRVEWKGTVELAREQAEHYGFPFVTVKREGTVTDDGRVLGDLLDQVEERHASNLAKGKDHAPWPSSEARWCTSDQKTSQVKKLMTALCELRRAQPGHEKDRVRILNVLGIRADESPKRSKMSPLSVDPASNKTVKDVVRWYPIFDWSTEQVWERNAQAGTRHHEAYDLGMPRLSCAFCVFAPKSALVVAAKHNPELAKEYQRVELRVGFRFKNDLSMTEIIEAAESDEEVTAENWAA